MTTTERTKKLLDWTAVQLNTSIKHTCALAHCAGFRRYYRLQLSDGNTILAVDSPSASDNNAGFITLSAAFLQSGITTPKVLAEDQNQGFLVVTDLGDITLENALTQHDTDTLYKSALDNLVKMQTLSDKLPFNQLPIFDRELILQQLNNCRDFFLCNFLKLTLTPEIQQQLTDLFDCIYQHLLQQPIFVMHADYQCRNIMLLPDHTLGILDFQDAHLGPVTYDVASLLWDCYLDWPMSQVIDWLHYYHNQLCQHKLINVNQQQFVDWFYWAGLQRHLKNLFIFARKWLRDQQPEYLPYLPRTLHYVLTSLSHFSELTVQQQWWATVVQPKLQQQLASETLCAR